MFIKRQWVNVVRVIWAAYEMPPDDQTYLLSCLSKHHRVFFLLVWRMTTDNEWFVVDSRFFSILLSLKPKKIHGCPFYFLISQFQFLFFWFYIFILNTFIKSFFFFNLVIRLHFVMYYFLHFGPYSFDF